MTDSKDGELISIAYNGFKKPVATSLQPEDLWFTYREYSDGAKKPTACVMLIPKAPNDLR
jgi:hypothetical protein